MPRGKELEQLPMANVAPSIGDDKSKYNREGLSGMEREETPHTSKAGETQTKQEEGGVPPFLKTCELQAIQW